MTIEKWPREGYRRLLSWQELQARKEAEARGLLPVAFVKRDRPVREACWRCRDVAELTCVEGVGWLCVECVRSLPAQHSGP